MVKQQRVRRKGYIKVTFLLRPAKAATVHVMGDFNDWRPIHAMRRRDDGEWHLSLELERGHEYQFKYLLDETVWITDPDAERSVADPYGGANSVVAT